MTLRFMVGIDPFTDTQHKLFREFVSSKGGSWWQWIGNLWLLKFGDNAGMTTDILWTRAAEINPAARIFVTQVESSSADWVVTDVVNSKGKKMSEWLQKNWMDD